MKYLITGNGSFTNGIIPKLLQMEDTKEIRVFSRNEKNQVDSKLQHNDDRIKFVVGDIRDYYSINEALNGIDYVLHSAAMKHIDKCEQFPLEAKKTNIDGSINVILASIENRVKKVVLLSTDKATNSITIYGNTKMFMEMFAQCVDNKDTEIITTRYGNVLGSNGSVVSIWKQLAKDNKPLTITDRNLTRFFMSLDEATELVLHALQYGQHKDLWVYNNKSCTIGELADLISDNQIITRLRCIEKTDEALLTINELNHSILDGNYYRVAKDITSNIEHTQPLTSDTTDRFSKEELERLINEC